MHRLLCFATFQIASLQALERTTNTEAVALFSTQPGVLPFHVDFPAFVKSYFALAFFFCIVWTFLSQWDSLVMIVRSKLERTDDAVQVPSGSTRDPTHGERTCEESDNNLVIAQENVQMSNSIPVPQSSAWCRFSAGLFLRRGGQQETSERANEPAGLTAVVCV